MKSKYFLCLIITTALLLVSWNSGNTKWLNEKHKGYTFYYTSVDAKDIKEYNRLIVNGIRAVNLFFNSDFKKEFNIVIHPNRESLDSIWRKDWKMPDFKSECWMVASSIADKLDMIAPNRWDKEACEHIYSETKKTRQLITPELIHVYHGQLNVSPDFSNTEGIDWFVEGLATFASGQCDSLRISEVKEAIHDNNIPDSLENLWSGKIKYGLSGSVVMFIDYKYGRTKLKVLLPLNKKAEILSVLKTSESELLDGWKKYILNL